MSGRSRICPQCRSTPIRENARRCQGCRLENEAAIQEYGSRQLAREKSANTGSVAHTKTIATEDGGGSNRTTGGEQSVTRRQQYDNSAMADRPPEKLTQSYLNAEVRYHTTLERFMKEGDTWEEATSRLKWDRRMYGGHFEEIEDDEAVRHAKEHRPTTGLRGGGGDDDPSDADDEGGVPLRKGKYPQISPSVAASSSKLSVLRRDDEYTLRETEYCLWLRMYIRQGHTREEAVAKLYQERERFGLDFETIAAEEDEREKARIRQLHDDRGTNRASKVSEASAEQTIERGRSYQRQKTRRLSTSRSDVTKDTEMIESIEITQDDGDFRDTRTRDAPSGLRGGGGSDQDDDDDLESYVTDLKLSSDPVREAERSRRARKNLFKHRRELYRARVDLYQAYGYTREEAKTRLRRDNPCGSDLESIAASEDEEFEKKSRQHDQQNIVPAITGPELDVDSEVNRGHKADDSRQDDTGHSHKTGHAQMAGGTSSSHLHPDHGRNDTPFLAGAHNARRTSLPQSDVDRDTEMKEDPDDTTRR